MKKSLVKSEAIGDVPELKTTILAASYILIIGALVVTIFVSGFHLFLKAIFLHYWYVKLSIILCIVLFEFT